MILLLVALVVVSKNIKHFKKCPETKKKIGSLTTVCLLILIFKKKKKKKKESVNTEYKIY